MGYYQNDLYKIPWYKKRLWMTIIAGVAFLLLLFGIYSFLFLPYYNKTRLSACLSYEKTRYMTAWAQDCKKYNRQIDKNGLCTLNKAVADSLNKIYDNQKNICNTKFK